MAETSAFLAAEILGWKKTDDGEYALVGFKDGEGTEGAIAFPKSQLLHLMICALDARSMTPRPKGLGVKETDAIDTNWYEVGGDAQGNNVVLTFYRESDGHITFRLDRLMAERLLETLQAGLQKGDAELTPGTSKN